ncbi:MAG: pyridoxamine 5'-phosphate oxidase family protein, partial [Myxococcota bacterium]
MEAIETISDLEALYEPVVPAAVTKVLPSLSPLYRKWIGASRFLILSTILTTAPSTPLGLASVPSGPIVER